MGKKPKLEKYTTNYSHYKLLTADEIQALAVKNTERLSQLEATSLLFQEYETKLNEFKLEQEKTDEWTNYLACDGLPHTYIPAEIRTFLNKLTIFEEEDFRTSFSWLLMIDERSILTQDIDSKNQTKPYLKRHLRKNIGVIYEEFIAELLLVYKNVLKTLETRFQVQSEEQYEDIKKLKTAIQEKMKYMYDHLTYRTIGNEANLDPVTVRSAEYNYKAEDFSLDIWTFLNVPITFDLEEMPSYDVILKTIEVAITLPFAVLYENLVIRGIYINYDHYSEFSRTSKISTYIPVEPDLKKKLKQEWKDRLAIQKDIKDKMKEERRVFEEYLILKDLEEKEAAKNKDKPKPKTEKKKKKQAIEPPIVDHTFPDVENDFLQFIQEEHIKMQNQFVPELLDLEENEINLREYTPIGGIYELNFVHKTDQVIISNIIMKWFPQPRKLTYIDKLTEIKKEEEEEELTFAERRSRRFSRVVKEEQKRIVQNFEITFKLPHQITKWSDPVGCHFCLGNDTVNIQREENLVENVQKTEPIITTTVPIILNDFNIAGYLNNEQIYNIIQYALPRTISSYQIHEELIDIKKSGGGALKKFKNIGEEEDDDKVNDLELMNKKDVPERLFPKYPKLQPIVILENLNKNVSDDEKYFRDLINDFQQYQIIKQPYFIIRDLPTKKLKQLINIEKQERARRISSRSTAAIHILQKKKSGKRKGDLDDTATIATNITVDQSETIVGDGLSVIKDIELEEVSIEDVPEVVKEVKEEQEFIMGTIRANIMSNLEEDKTKWSTKHIISSYFNRERSELTITTDRLGIFAFMFPKFIHFPYKTWSLFPDPQNPREHVIFYLETSFAKFTFKITEKGYFVEVKNFAFGKNLKIYFKNEEPITDLTYLKQEMSTRNLNIFPDPDSYAYIKGRLQEKLLPMELHNYNCMAIYSLFLKFSMSEWNWISDPRILIYKGGELRDKEDELTLIKITPEESSFVDIVELCSADVDNIILQYTPTWRNIEYNSDLVSLITTSFGGAYNNRIKDPRMYHYVSQLLGAIRPLSSC